MDSQDQVGVTKLGGVAPDVSLEGARNIVLSLVYGRLTFNDYGAAATPRALLAVALVAACCVVLWRRSDRRRIAFWLTGRWRSRSSRLTGSGRSRESRARSPTGTSR